LVDVDQPARPRAPARARRTAKRRTRAAPADDRAEEEAYTVQKSPHFAETHTWLVIVDGEQVGQIRPAFTAGRTRRWEPYVSLGAGLGQVRAQVLGSPSNTCKTVQDAAVQVLMAWQRTRRSRSRGRRR